MMDVNERTSVRPYGKEVRVFSSPNCYLSLKQSVFSLFPAAVSQVYLHSQLNPEKTLSGAKCHL